MHALVTGTAGFIASHVSNLLLDHGADPTATDPEYHATPRQWAEFLGRPVVAAYLRERAGPERRGSR